MDPKPDPQPGFVLTHKGITMRGERIETAQD